MAITLTETDTNSDLAMSTGVGTQNFTSNGVDSSNSSKQATAGGTAGVTAVSLTSALSSNADIAFFSKAAEPNSTAWESGSWTVRLEITTANMNLGNGGAKVIRANSAGVSQEMIGGDVAFDSAWSATGVKTATFTGNASSGASATDRIYVMISPTNNSGMSQSFAFKPSQNITTPVTQGGAASTFVAGAPLVVAQAVRRAAYWFRRLLTPARRPVFTVFA